MKVVIISGGNSPSYTLIKKELRESEYLIAADSGANALFKYDVFPDYIIGDLDSIKTVALNYYKDRKVSILQYPPEKDYTDTEIAVNKAIDLGATEIVLLGCTGSRIDHLFGNIGMLLKCLKLGVSCVIKDDNNIIFLTETSTKIRGSLGKTFSIIPYSEEISDLTIIGAKYPLDNYKMKIGSAIGISNVFEEDEVKIEFNSGRILIIYPTD